MIEQLTVHEVPIGIEPRVGAVLGQLDIPRVKRLIEGDSVRLEVQPAAGVEDTAERMVPKIGAGNVERRNRIGRRGQGHCNRQTGANDKSFRLHIGYPL